MALATTTLSVACGVNDKSIVVASATSMAAGRFVLIDNEMMQVTKDYTSGTTVPVLRGRDGTAQVAHVITANVTHGDGNDFSSPVAGGPPVTYGVMRPVFVQSITASQTITLPSAGCDWRIILNGTSVINLVIPAPTKDMDGTMCVVISNGAAAHTVQYTGGLGAAGSSYDVITNNAAGQMALVAFAANGAWQIPQAPALTGTVTNITGGIA
jgi:hypothetical protein